MARVKIVFPDQIPLFKSSIAIRITDLNYGNHLGNDRLLGILHEARVQWLDSLGLTELNIGGCGLIMADMIMRYQNEGFYGDILEISLYADAVSQSTFDLLYKIKVERAGEQISLAAAKTGMVCFDYKIRKVIPIPRAFHSHLTIK